MRALAAWFLLAASGLVPMSPVSLPAPPRRVYLDCTDHLPAPMFAPGPSPESVSVRIPFASHPRGFGPYMTVDGALAGTIWSPGRELLEFRPLEAFSPGRHTVSVFWSGHACSWQFWVAGEGVAAPRPRASEVSWFSPTGPAALGERPPTIQSARFVKGDDDLDADHSLACPDKGDRVPHPPPPGTLAPAQCRHLPYWRFHLAATGSGLEPVALLFSIKEEHWEGGDDGLPAREIRHAIRQCLGDLGPSYVAIRECLSRYSSEASWSGALCNWALVGVDEWVGEVAHWVLEIPVEKMCSRPWHAVVWNDSGDWARVGPVPLPDQVQPSVTTNEVSGDTTLRGWGWGRASVPDHGGYDLPADEDPNLAP